MIPIAVVAGLTLLASFLCSLFEATLYAISPSQIEVLRTSGARGSERLARLRENVDEPIAAILTVNTIAHTVGAAWCGAMVGEEFGSGAVGIFAAVFTVLVLAVTEIVPKSLGVRYAPTLAPFIALPLQIMIWATWPVVWIAHRAMRMLGSEEADGPSEDEVLAVSRLAARAGGVRKEEHRWLHNALRLDAVTAGELRTPRTVVETLDADRSVSEVLANIERWVHTRVPVIEDEHPDRVIGQAHRRDVIDAALQQPGEELLVRDLMRPIEFVPETTPGNELLDRFLTARTHMVAVVDEYGGFEGIVTLEDVLENMLGAAIVDEHDEVEDMKALALERARNRRASQEETTP